MNRIATKLPEGQRPAHRRRPIWLLLALLTLGPAVGLAQTYTTIDCPDALLTYARSINDRGEIVGICEDADGAHGFLLRHGRFTLIDVPGATEGRQRPSASTIGATWSDATSTTPTSFTGFCSGTAASRRSMRRAPLHPRPRHRRSRADRRLLRGKRRGLPRVHPRFEWLPGHRFPGRRSTAAFDINALKQIVGGYFDTSGIPTDFS